MHKKITIVVFSIAIALSIWFYGHSDLKLKKLLTSTEWNSTVIVFNDHWKQGDKLTDKARIFSTYKYLPNGQYLKQSTIKFSRSGQEDVVELNISESGQWNISDHYLLITPDEFKDTSLDNLTSRIDNQEQIDNLKEYFKLNSQLSRKIDHIDKNTLLMTDLDHGSALLNAVNNS